MTNKELEEVLKQALAPVNPYGRINETVIRRMEKKEMRKKINFRKMAVVTAVCCLLVGTVSMAASGEIKSSISGMIHGKYTEFENLQKAEKKAGFQINALEKFSNGYVFSEMCVQDIKDVGEADKVMQTYKEISFTYEKDGEAPLYMHAMQERYAHEESDRYPNQSIVIEDVEVSFYVDTYKWVPEEYELTMEDKEKLKRADYYISDGAGAISEDKVSHAVWYQSGIRYGLMIYKEVSSDELFSIAAELIKNNG